MRSVGLGHKLRLRICQLNAKRTGTSFKGGRTQDREARRPFLGHVAIIAFNGARDVHSRLIKRLAGDEIDRTRNTAVDHVGSVVLEDFDTTKKFRRDIVEREFASAIGRKDIAPIEFGTHKGKTADDDARSFNRETVRVITLFEARNVDARYTLQRFGDRTVCKRTDVFGSNHIDECVGFLLDALRIFERLAETGDDNFVFSLCRSFFLFGRLCEGRLRGQHTERQAGSRRKRRKTAGTREF